MQHVSTSELVNKVNLIYKEIIQVYENKDILMEHLYLIHIRMQHA